MNKLIIFLIVLLILVGGSGALYFFVPAVEESVNRLINKNAPASNEVGQATEAGSVSGTSDTPPGPTISSLEFAALLARIPNIKQKLEAKEILTDERYLSLQDFSQITPEDKGNPIPFKRRDSGGQQAGQRTSR